MRTSGVSLSPLYSTETGSVNEPGARLAGQQTTAILLTVPCIHKYEWPCPAFYEVFMLA